MRAALGARILSLSVAGVLRRMEAESEGRR